MIRGIALLFPRTFGARWWWWWGVSPTHRPHFTPGKDPVPILQDAGWAPGPVWTGGKFRPHRDSIPDRPARSSVAIPTELLDLFSVNRIFNILMFIFRGCIAVQFRILVTVKFSFHAVGGLVGEYS